MEQNNEKLKRLTKWIIGIAAACILIYLLASNIGVVATAVSWVAGLVAPLLVGFVLSLVLNVPMSFIEKRLWRKAKKKVLIKLRRPVAMVLSIVIILGVLAGVILLVIPELVNAVKILVESVIELVTRVSAMDAEEISQLPFGSVIMSTDWEEIITSLQNWLKAQSSNIMNIAVGTIGSVFGIIFDLFISIIFAVYILLSKEKLKKQAARLIRAWLPERFGEWAIHAAAVASKMFRSFVSGQTLEAVILGLLCMIGMFIFGIPYAPMIGALVGVTALIPVVGAFAGAIVGAFMILTVSPVKALIFVIFLVVLQQLEGNLIYPRVMGSKVNLPAMWILAAVTVGGGLAGPVGMLLSVPIASTLYVLIREATEKREKKLKNKN